MEAVDDYLAGIGLFLPHNQFHKGAFARAGRADYKYKLTRIDLYVNVIERMGSGRIGFGNALKLNNRFFLIRKRRIVRK